MTTFKAFLIRYFTSHFEKWLLGKLIIGTRADLKLKNSESRNVYIVYANDGTLDFNPDIGRVNCVRRIDLNDIRDVKIISPKEVLIKNFLKLLKSTDLNRASGDMNDYLVKRDLPQLKNVLKKLDILNEPDVQRALKWLKSQLHENVDHWWWPDPPVSSGWVIGDILHGVDVKLTFDSGDQRDVNIFAGESKEFQATPVKDNGSRLMRAYHYRIDHIKNLEIKSPTHDVIKNLLHFLKRSTQNGDLKKSEISTVEELLKRLKIADNPDVKKIIDWLKKQDLPT